MFTQKVIRIKMILLSIICIFIGSLFVDGAQAAMTVNQDCLDVASLSDNSLNSMRSLKILFGHMSVGFNTIDGLNDLASQNTRYLISISEITSTSPVNFESPILGHFRCGSNGYPESKISDFDGRVRNTYGEVIDVAFFKFCPFDITGTTDVISLFNTYKSTMDALKSSYSDITFVHLTCPLTVFEDTANIKRNEFNTLLLNEYNDKEYIFDIASIEATHEDGTRATFTSIGQTCYKLCSEYTTDNVHLNDSLNIGRQRLAKGMIYLLTAIAGGGSSVDYYVSNSGDDNNSGTSLDAPWKTINKVNNFAFSAGDTIHFKKGDVWREQLVPRSGSAQGDITYTSYGEGNKPLLLGSLEKNSPVDWINEMGNIWAINPPVTGNELLSNPSFDTGTNNWFLSVQTASGAAAAGSRDTENYDSFPAGYKIQCTNNGSAIHHILLYTPNLNIVEGRYYKLSFRAKCTSGFTLPLINLMGSLGSLSSLGSNLSANITSDWTPLTVLYQANTTTSENRIVFFLGEALPEGSAFYIDSLSFKELTAAPCYLDVGNIIFNNGEICGIKVWGEGDLDEQNEFWYDENNKVLKVYSTQNPAVLYNDIECAITRHIIDESNKSYVVYEALHLAYGGAHGIGGPSADHIVVRDCDLSFIGGGKQAIAPPGAPVSNVRYGNAVEFWDNANNNLVEGCNIWEIYDAALTNQGRSNSNSQYNITYRNNKIWNCEYSFEYWDQPDTATMHDICFENNICLDAGQGWSHSQRPDPSGRHLCAFTNTAQTYNLSIRNNIFVAGQQAGVWFLSNDGRTAAFNGIENLDLDYNTYYQPQGENIVFWGRVYTTDDFSLYQDNTGKDIHSKLIILNDLLILTSSLPEAGINQFYSQTVQATGGVSPYTWQIASGKPDWLSIDESTGEIIGIPLKEGMYAFTVQVSDAVSKIAEKELLLTVRAAGIKGDINGDDKIDVFDVQACVNVILLFETDINKVKSAREVAEPLEECNVRDVQEIVNLILYIK